MKRGAPGAAAGGTPPALLLRHPPLHGNTARGRLSLVDTLLAEYEPWLFRAAAVAEPSDAGELEVVLDIGMGAEPTTTIELARALRPRLAAGRLRLVGTEVDADRLAAAERWLAAHPETSADLAVGALQFRRGEAGGWFALPLAAGERLVAARVLNVLRDYHPRDAQRVRLTRPVLPLSLASL
jgi:hypothetical protein